MRFVAGWALVGLALLAPLVILHLRQSAADVRDVPSLLLWHEFALDAPGRGRRLRPPPLPLLLALQAAALILLVVALAEPVFSGDPVRPVTVVVLDDSFWMTAPGVLADARREVDQAVGAVPAGAPVRIVLADGTPAVLYRGPASGAAAAVSRVRASAAPADLARGLTVAAGLLSGPRDRIVLVHAPQDSAPTLRASPGELATRVAGSAASDQGVFDPTARCGIGTASTCEVVATVVNTSPSPAAAHVLAQVPGHPSVSVSVRVGANASAPIRLLADPGEQLSLTLTGSDAVRIDNQAWVTVPGNDNIPRAAAVTVVGAPAQARSLAQAFAAVPGVTLRLETAAGYRAAVARTSDLVVLDAALPGGDLPPAPAVMLVDPPRLPGGEAGRLQASPLLSGTDPASPLLQDADMSSLTVETARRLTLPRWLVPALWSPSGPLLAAGDEGRGPLLVTSFQPGNSNLAQLAAFPVLAANIVRWSLGWAPATALAGSPISVDALPGAQLATLARNGTVVDRVKLHGAMAAIAAVAPGVYTLFETGRGVSHHLTIDVNLGAPTPPSSVPIDLRTAQLHAGRRPGTPPAPWLLLAALVVLALEWAYWSTQRTQVSV